MNDIDIKFKELANELDASDSKFEEITNSYTAVGEYLSNNLKVNVRIFPQGSFALGTVIKPTSDEDDYDIDLVCDIEKEITETSELKNIVGDALKESERYSKILDSKEGKRCWTLIYSDKSRYHMDILPAIKDSNYELDKKLKITHKENGKYEKEFRKTSPEAYQKWFENVQAKEYNKKTEEYSQKFSCDIADVPKYKIKTNLQIAIQLIKRYRDIKFVNQLEDKPISIILTTIMTKLYIGNETVYELISKFSKDWENCFIKENNNYILKNPINDEEEFTDKWKNEPKKQETFIYFMEELKKDFKAFDTQNNINNIEEASNFKKMFGENIVKNMYENIGRNYLENRNNGSMNVNANGYVNFNEEGIKVEKHNFYGE